MKQFRSNHGKFVNHVKDVTAALPAQGAIDQREEEDANKVGATPDIGQRG
jgi:hypothetical protein